MSIHGGVPPKSLILHSYMSVTNCLFLFVKIHKTNESYYEQRNYERARQYPKSQV